MRRQPIARILQASSGMSLLAVLVAVAVLGVIVATLTALFGNLSSSLLRGNIEAQERNVINYVRVLLAQPQICDYALRAAAPGPLNPPDVKWDFVNFPASEGTINFIEINRQGTVAVPSVGVKTGTLSPDLKITRIYIRRFRPELGEGNPPPLPPKTIMKVFKRATQTSAVPQPFDVTPAKVVVRFEVIGNAPILGAPVRELTADVTVAVDQVDRIVSFCHQDQAVQSIDMTCDAAHLYAGEPDCPVSNPPCWPLYYIRGFDSLGVAMCACQTSCQDNYVAPVPGPGPTVPGPGPTVPGPGPAVPGPGPSSRIGPGPTAFGGVVGSSGIGGCGPGN